MEGATGAGRRQADVSVGRRVAALRLLTGVFQGLALYVVERPGFEAWLHAGRAADAALTLVIAYTPLILLAGAGRMRRAVLAAWMAAAAALLVLLAAYDAWREGGPGGGGAGPSLQLIVFGGVALYVLHHLIEPADEARSLRPPYAAYVEGSWRHAFQLAVSLVFTGVLAGVLNLAAALFASIGVDAVASTLRSGWLDAPLLGLAFAGAVHQTDVRPGLIEGVRNVALTLLAWLLVLASGLIAAFLLALLFTGLKPLWSTHVSAWLLLVAAAVLVLLVNAAYQDGRGREALPAVVRWAARLAGALLPFLVAIAAWSLVLRVGQYGLTPERTGGLAVSLVAAVYAGGYAWAAAARGPWMRPLETVNLVGAVAVAGAVLLLLSPVADPARLSTADQLARLRRGATPLASFDFAALRSSEARYGREALLALAASPDPKVAEPARAVQEGSSESGALLPPVPPVHAGPPLSGARVLPAGAGLPEGFRSADWKRGPNPPDATDCRVSAAPCELYVLDMDGDGVPEVIEGLGTEGVPLILKRGADGLWSQAGTLMVSNTDDVRPNLEAGRVHPAPRLLPDLRVGDQVMEFNPTGP